MWILLYLLLACDVHGTVSDRARTQYGRDVLLQLNSVSGAGVTDITAQLPDFILRDPDVTSGAPRNKKRKRGKQGGVGLRLRKLRLTRIPLPMVIMGNVQSLRNKVDKLQGNVRWQKDFRDCCVMAFTETWLTERNQDSHLFIDGFEAPFCLDRKAEVTRKTQGGGVCLYFNKRYCSSVTVRERICTPDVELLSVSLCPFYLHREFPQLFITTTVYIHCALPTGVLCLH